MGLTGIIASRPSALSVAKMRVPTRNERRSKCGTSCAPGSASASLRKAAGLTPSPYPPDRLACPTSPPPPSPAYDSVYAHNRGRDPRRLALKLTKMAASPFAFFRGACHRFYEVLPDEGVTRDAPAGWIAGDLHLENFGSYKGDNRLVYFDLNDFDEACLAPLTWDVVRFQASVFLGSGPARGRRRPRRAARPALRTPPTPRCCARAMRAGSSVAPPAASYATSCATCASATRPTCSTPALPCGAGRRAHPRGRRARRREGPRGRAARAARRRRRSPRWARPGATRPAATRPAARRRATRCSTSRTASPGTGSLGLPRYVILTRGDGGRDGRVAARREGRPRLRARAHLPLHPARLAAARASARPRCSARCRRCRPARLATLAIAGAPYRAARAAAERGPRGPRAGRAEARAPDAT